MYNGSISALNEYLSTADRSQPIGYYSMKKEANPADHALDVFCGPLGAGSDWVELFKQSYMCRKIGDTVNGCSCSSCEAGEISVDPTPQSFASELFLVLQRQALAHWRTTSYTALRYDFVPYYSLYSSIQCF